MLDSISSKESNFAEEVQVNINKKGDVFSKKIERGNYLLEVSGHFECSQGNKHLLTWTIEADGKKHEVSTCMYSNSCYGYPFSLRQEILMTNQGKLKISVGKDKGNFNLSTTVVSLTPMILSN